MAKYEMPLPQTVEEWAFFNMTTAMSWRLTLRELARAHGDKAGQWLDELEQRCFAEAKGVIYDGPHDVEAKGKSLAIQYLTIQFRSMRNQLETGRLDE